VDIDRNGIGEPVYVWKKPDVGKAFPITAPQSDDDFNSQVSGLQWQFNHNPVPEAWSLSRRPGWLSLKALKAEDFMQARNTLTQKVMGNTGEAATELDISQLADGQKAGLCSMSKVYNLIGACKKEGKTCLFYQNNAKVYQEKVITAGRIFLKIKLDSTGNKNQFYYSLDNKTFIAFGDTFETKWGYWKGTRIGLFSYNERSDGGTAFFNWFTYDYDGPEGAEGTKEKKQ
jgi:beta-xylosidase